MSGSAVDNAGVASVKVAIHDRTRKPGGIRRGTWGRYVPYDAAPSASGVSSSSGWSYSWIPPGPGRFAVAVETWDLSGSRTRQSHMWSSR